MVGRAVVMGATSGIGREMAKLLLQKGWCVAVASRRESLLRELAEQWPGQVLYSVIDVNKEEASSQLCNLISELGGMDLYLQVSGIGYYNPELDAFKELTTTQTNTLGFTRMVDTAFEWLAANGGGCLAAITSIASTKGLGASPAYSASKRYQRNYLDALDQQARFRKLDIKITDIRPGFVDTDFLRGDKFPMLLNPSKVAAKAIKAILKGKRCCVIDWRYRILVAFWHLVPQWLWYRLKIK